MSKDNKDQTKKSKFNSSLDSKKNRRDFSEKEFEQYKGNLKAQIEDYVESSQPPQENSTLKTTLDQEQRNVNNAKTVAMDKIQKQSIKTQKIEVEKVKDVHSIADLNAWASKTEPIGTSSYAKLGLESSGGLNDQNQRVKPNIRKYLASFGELMEKELGKNQNVYDFLDKNLHNEIRTLFNEKVKSQKDLQGFVQEYMPNGNPLIQKLEEANLTPNKEGNISRHFSNKKSYTVDEIKSNVEHLIREGKDRVAIAEFLKGKEITQIKTNDNNIYGTTTTTTLSEKDAQALADKIRHDSHKKTGWLLYKNPDLKKTVFNQIEGIDEIVKDLAKAFEKSSKPRAAYKKGKKEEAKKQKNQTQR